jgi:hypothetical protein
MGIPFASTVRWAISVTRLLLRFDIDLYALDRDSKARASPALPTLPSGARCVISVTVERGPARHIPNQR